MLIKRLKHQMLIKRLKKKIVPLAIDFLLITTQLAIDIFYSFFWLKYGFFFFGRSQNMDMVHTTYLYIYTILYFTHVLL